MSILKNMLGNEDNEIHTESMYLSKNILKFSHTTIQLSNISKVTVGTIETKIKFPFFAIFIALISLGLLSIQFLLGLIGLILSVGYIYYIYKNIPVNKIFLNLNLNSGGTYSIYFIDSSFAEKVRLSIESAFNGSMTHPLNIDMSTKEIYEISGDNNSVHSHNNSNNTDNSIHNSGNNNSGNSSIGHNATSTMSTVSFLDSTFDWENIITSLSEVVNALKDDTSSVKITSEEALKIAQTKDKSKFIEYINVHRMEFTSEIFKAVASGFIVELFSKIIN